MKNILAILIISLIFSCEEKTIKNDVSNDDINLIIKDLENSTSIDTAKVSNLLESINSFSEANPTDKNTPRHLELKAKYLAAMGNNEEAIAVYTNIYSNYKEYPNRSSALFMVGFIYDDNMKQKAKAHIFYQKYLDEFPNGELAASAKFSIENLDKTDEEILKELLKKNMD